MPFGGHGAFDVEMNQDAAVPTGPYLVAGGILETVLIDIHEPESPVVLKVSLPSIGSASGSACSVLWEPPHPAAVIKTASMHVVTGASCVPAVTLSSGRVRQSGAPEGS